MNIGKEGTSSMSSREKEKKKKKALLYVGSPSVYIVDKVEILTSNGMYSVETRFELKTSYFDTVIKYRLFSKNETDKKWWI